MFKDVLLNFYIVLFLSSHVLVYIHTAAPTLNTQAGLCFDLENKPQYKHLNSWNAHGFPKTLMILAICRLSINKGLFPMNTLVACFSGDKNVGTISFYQVEQSHSHRGEKDAVPLYIQQIARKLLVINITSYSTA